MTHETEIAENILKDARERRGGKRFAFDPLEPVKMALLVIDMQIFFVQPGPDGKPLAAQGIVPNINSLAREVRNSGGVVVWVTSDFGDDIGDKWSVLMRHIYSAERSQVIRDNLRPGGPGYPLWPELETRPEDWHVTKDRFSAFIQGASDLEDRLKEAGIDTLVITGTLTNVCCESTARDAMMRNFKTLVITDANAANSDEDHNNALSALARVFVDVMSTDELIDRLGSDREFATG